MKIIVDRRYCDAALPFWARCSAAFFRHPLGTDRPCIIAVIDEGRDELLHFEVRTDGRTLDFDLTQEIQAGLALEGGEFLADFAPSFFRRGAAARWRALATWPSTHPGLPYSPARDSPHRSLRNGQRRGDDCR